MIGEPLDLFVSSCVIDSLMSLRMSSIDVRDGAFSHISGPGAQGAGRGTAPEPPGRRSVLGQLGSPRRPGCCYGTPDRASRQAEACQEEARYVGRADLPFLGSASRVNRTVEAVRAIKVAHPQQQDATTSGRGVLDRDALPGAETPIPRMALRDLAMAGSGDWITEQLEPIELPARAAGAGGRLAGEDLQHWE